MIPMGVFTGLFVGFAVNYVKAKVDKKHILFALTVGCGLLVFLPMTQIEFPIALPINFASSWITAIGSTLLIIVLGVFFIYGDKYLRNTKFNKITSLNTKKAFVALVIFLALVAPTVSTAYYTTSHVGPGISDPMWNALTWVEGNTVNDTTMASWWDFGYAFEIAADRPTIFDGGSQDGQRAHWIGKAIFTNDSALSAGILEAMATYGNLPFDTLDNYTNNTAKTVKILDETIPMEKEEAISTMINEYNLTQAQADRIGELSHPSNPKPVIFVMSSDMQGKSYWWSYFGGWDFNSLNGTGFSYFYNDQPVEMVKVNNSTGEAIVVNSAEQYATVITNITKNYNNNSSVHGVVSVLNPQTNKTILDQNGSVYNPFSIYREMVIDDGQLVKNETLNKSGEYTLLILGSGGFYTAYLMNKELEGSMFTKLYILQGFGQTNFEMIQVPKETSGIFLYRVISDTPMFKTDKNQTG
jgi:dolichyl-diphosphooligosaccharide--protein glycosyltransferase